MIDKAIFIVPNRNQGEFVTVRDVWPNDFYFDSDGNLIKPVDENDNFLTQQQIEALPNYAGKKPFLFELGKADLIPTWDPIALEAVVRSKFFAHPDCEQDIANWFNEGLDSTAIYQKLVEAGRLVKASDVGLENVTEYSEPQKG